MTDRVLLSAGRNNIEECIELACQHDLGIEVMAFAFPDILDGNWSEMVSKYRAILRMVPGEIALHGPFMDMVSGSPDARINAVCMDRYKHAISIAAELRAKVIVFHANFIGTIHNPEYRVGWHDRNVDFWHPIGEFAQQHGVTVAIENMWEFDPDIIANLLKAVDHPHLRACLDVGHAYLFADKESPFDLWLETMEPWLVHTHVNNTDGKLDLHYSLDNGVINYHDVLNKLRAVATPPSITLEMYKVEEMRASLPLLQIRESKYTLA